MRSASILAQQSLASAQTIDYMIRRAGVYDLEISFQGQVRYHAVLPLSCAQTFTPQILFARKLEVLPGPLDISSATMFLSNTSVVGKLEQIQVSVYDAFGNAASQSDMMQLKLWVVDTMQNSSYAIKPDSIYNGSLRCVFI